MDKRGKAVEISSIVSQTCRQWANLGYQKTLIKNVLIDWYSLMIKKIVPPLEILKPVLPY